MERYVTTVQCLDGAEAARGLRIFLNKDSQSITDPRNAGYHGKADGTDCGQEACSGLRKEKRTSPKPRRIQSRNSHWENIARLAYDDYEGFQRKEQTLAVAVDLQDAYSIVQFKLLMELLVQYDVSLTLTR